ncbi:MAG TPA: D-alanyl-D-alanine carboxypeptidase family protein [Xanthomonadaceae bacterium]|nr:D-alanyl-D-alanine carboxypeptidase family protein [Xanthomonadaceae bacterium]
MMRFLLSIAGLAAAFSQVSAQAPVPAPTPIPAVPSVGASSYVLLDFQSGRVLASRNPDQALPPASLTKVMTAFMIFAELEAGRLALDEMVTVSEKAWRRPGSRMFIEVGKQVSVQDLLKGMIVQSGNDATLALAEHVAGSEEAFADLMSRQARALGMANTHFVTVDGLPGEGHVSSARDMAVLARAMVARFPDYYAWYSEREFTYNGIRQHNRNSLLWRDESVDGLKTGHTEAAGYCLIASAMRGDMRLISVVMGSASERSRADESQALLNYGFRFFESHRLYTAGATLAEPRLWKGEHDSVPLGVDSDVVVTLPRGAYERLSANLRVQCLAPGSLDRVEC